MLNDKQKIIDYSGRVFFKEGFYKITLNEIASGLMISKNTIYKHFKSKDELLQEVVNVFLAGMYEGITKIAESNTNSVNKFISLLNFASSKLAQHSPKWHNDLKIYAPDLWQKIDNFRKEKLHGFLSKVILQGQKEELVEKFPPPIIIEIFVSSVRSVINPYFLTSSDLSYQLAAKSVFDILLNGILTKKGKKVYKNFSSQNHEIH
ncbi:MAG: TetR/AcrR family transcriptional regulator [Ignavibacteria bacterium]|nr:TetR/AcrR family transcriptional regulator [Ignavibacteria bacterium]